MGVYDPTGPIVNYILAGAQFVIGNLWDVTDKDIDKLSIQCMETLFNKKETHDSSANMGCVGTSVVSLRENDLILGNGENMLIEVGANHKPSSICSDRDLVDSSAGSIKVTKALSSSRNVCKLPYVVGCAPVMYGLPINFKQKS
jgi:separase